MLLKAPDFEISTLNFIDLRKSYQQVFDVSFGSYFLAALSVENILLGLAPLEEQMMEDLKVK